MALSTSLSLPNWLLRQAHHAPHHPAVITGDQTLNYSDLAQAAVGTAVWLYEAGVRPGTRVAVLMDNDLPFVEVVHALPLLQGILVPLNTRLTPSELAWQVRDVEADTIVYDHTAKETAAAIELDVPDVPYLYHDRPTQTGNSSFSFQGSIDLDRTHSILYTSGTTGRPKGAMLTYGNLWWSATASALNLGHDPADRWLACLPLFHIAGLSILTRAVIYGITAIVHPRFDPKAVNRAIDKGVTIVSVVSNMLARMLEQRGEKRYPESLRCIMVGGGPVPRSLLEQCAQRNVPVVQTYGLTETTSQFATLRPQDALSRLGSAGKPLLPNELRIDRDGQVAEPGEIGEIVLRGPTVTAGYFHRPDETTAAIKDGWLYTGDLGYTDADGYLYVVDRRSDLIVSGGENVYPAEIEAILLTHPDIREVGVYGLPDERWGQIPAAAVTLRSGADQNAEALIEWCRRHMAHYKAPAQFVFVSHLPRSSSGKLLRRLLPQLRKDRQS